MSRDVALLLDILTAASDAQGFVEGIDWDAFQQSRLHQNAVIRSIEIIGEASSKLSTEFKKEHPEIAWGDMIGMRNRLIHEYGGVRLKMVWDVVMVRLETLVHQLAALVPPP